MAATPIQLGSQNGCNQRDAEPLVAPDKDLGWLTDQMARLAQGPGPRWWKVGLAVGLAGVGLLVAMLAYQISVGVGVWGNNRPVMWGWDVINFVWWIGLGHAGTLISAILLLLRQRWRASVHRAAEAMTMFAVVCAALYPVVHVGRVWFDWWLLPLPNPYGPVWPQFRSPLMWDLFALGTYFTVSVVFCYTGLIPDLALMRDRARTKLGQWAYGLVALGWTGSARQWNHYQKAYLILAGLSTALVVSVHSVVALNFAASQLPGWHSTLFPPYFVVGAIFSGFGMVLVLLIPLRRWCRLEDVITPRHIDCMGQVTLAASLVLAYAYGTEAFAAWYGGNPYERDAVLQRAVGPLAWAYWAMIGCNVVVPQLFWWRRLRRCPAVVFGVALLINVGMWLERFVIIVGSLERDFLPANWSVYRPTWVDVGTYAGTLGLFLTCFLLFMRFLPLIPIFEVKSILQQAGLHRPPAAAGSTPAPTSEPTAPLYGLLAQFDTPAQLLQATQQVRQAGFQRWDGFTPYPVPGLAEAMGLKNSPVGWFAFAGGVVGGLLGVLMVWYMNTHDYGLLVGGKPMFSLWPAVPVAYELCILLAAIGVLIGLLFINRLPRWYHPLLKHARFAQATRDKFFLAIEVADPQYEASATRALLEQLGASQIDLVEA